MGSHIERVYLPKADYNVKFKECHDNQLWDNKFAELNFQLIDNVLSSNTYRFNRGYDMEVYRRVKERVIEKLIAQLLIKFNYEKGDNPFAFATSMIRWWGYKYVLQEAKRGLNPDKSLTYYDNTKREYVKISFISAF